MATEVVKRVFGEAVGGIPRDLSILVRTPHGDPGAVLAELAGRDDVLIVGRRPGHRTAKAVHGSISGYCACHCAGGVIAVSPDGSASLITPRRGLVRRS